MFRKLSIASGLKSSSGLGQVGGSSVAGASGSSGQGGTSKEKKKGKTVKYTPYSKHHLIHGNKNDDDDDLDEVAVISNTIPENVTYGSGQQHSVSGSSNGPRLVPGIITSTGFESKPYVPPPVPFAPKISSSAIQSVGVGQRKSLTGGSLLEPGTSSGIVGSESKAITSCKTPSRKISTDIGGPSTSNTRGQQSSQQRKGNEIETISSRINTSVVTHHSSSHHSHHSHQSESRIAIDEEEEKAIGSTSDFNLLVPKTGGPPSEPTSTTHQNEEEDDHGKHHSKGGGVREPLIHGTGHKKGRRKSDQVKDGSKSRKGGKKVGEKEVEKWESSTLTSGEKSGCNWSFVFDPSGRLIYYWSMIVSLAFIYNSWVILYRFAFEEINTKTMSLWLTLDGISDFIYVIDIAVHFRIGYLEEGVLQTDGTKLRQHYMNSTMFYIDCLCLLPLDFLYLSIGFNSMLRCFRLVKIYRFWAFLDRTERHTNYPNIFRTLSLFHYILVLFHWNACLYHLISMRGGFGSSDWFQGSRVAECSDVECDYLHAFYWSTLALTTIGDLPRPRTKGEYIFLIVELVLGLFLLATVLGHVANIVTNVSAARKEFQAKLDSVKTYMRMRRVPEHLKIKVIKWFDYLWMTQKSADEDKCVGFLPAKLKAEIAIHVHLDTLKRVEIFQNTEAGFLCALVLRLKPVLFSPSDYVCRKGEIGKEMYIVNRGKLQVVTDNGKTVLATLRAGSYFGEISILNMGNAGNRRTASVRSVGYSDLFCLNKHDMWEVLKDYPAARIRLEAIAVKRLEKYRKDPMKKSDENEILESVANRTLLSRSPKPSTPRPDYEDEDGMDLYDQGEEEEDDSVVSTIHSEPDPRKRNRHQKEKNLKVPPSPLVPPSFGVIPASPTTKVPRGNFAQGEYSVASKGEYSVASKGEYSLAPKGGGGVRRGEGSEVSKYFLSTSPSAWYERRTSSPQTPGEVMMATISPVQMVQGQGSPYGSFLAIRPAMSPTASSPILPTGSGKFQTGNGHHQTGNGHHQTGSGRLGIPESFHPSVSGSSVSSFGSMIGDHDRKSPLPRTPVPGEVSQEILLDEIKILRQKLHFLQSENNAMTIKLSNVHSEFEGRLTQIESHVVQSGSKNVANVSKLSSFQQSDDQSLVQELQLGHGQRETEDREGKDGQSADLGHEEKVISPASEFSNPESDPQVSSCGDEELSERNRESMI